MDIERLIQNLKKRNIDAKYFRTGQEAADYVVSTVENTTVGIGGSVTVEQLGLFERLQEKNEVFWHWKQERRFAEAGAAAASVYLASANAIAMSGEIVDIDGSGNRVSSMTYGHERLILLVGVNKITEDLPSAIERARTVAAPLNGRRLCKKTPCAVSEPPACYDCSSSDRMCLAMLILMGKTRDTGKLEVLLIDETLGF